MLLSMQPGKAQEYFHRYGEVSSVVQYLYLTCTLKIAVEIEKKLQYFFGKTSKLGKYNDT